MVDESDLKEPTKEIKTKIEVLAECDGAHL